MTIYDILQELLKKEHVIDNPQSYLNRDLNKCCQQTRDTIAHVLQQAADALDNMEFD